MRLATASVLVLLVATSAFATGDLAPAQARADVEAVCQGPVWNLYSFSRTPGVEEAAGECYDTAHSVFTLVFWARGVSGRRQVLRGAIDPTYVDVTDVAPTLTCLPLARGFEVCR